MDDMQQMIDQCVQMMGGMMGNGMMMGGGMMGMLLGGTLLLVAVIGMGVGLARRVVQTQAGARQPIPLTLLQERFARGEIGVEEYQQRRSVLHTEEHGETWR